MQPSGILYLQTQILTQIPLKWTETFHFVDLFPAAVKENKIQGKNKIKITSKKNVREATEWEEKGLQKQN